MQINTTTHSGLRIASTKPSRPVENQAVKRDEVSSTSDSYQASDFFSEVGEGLRQTIPLAMAVGLGIGAVTASSAGLTGLATALKVSAGIAGVAGVPMAALPMVMADGMPGVQAGVALGSLSSIAAGAYVLLS